MRVWTNRRSRLGETSDSGFTLIEAVVALSIAALLLTAVAWATVGGVKASAEGRINQQAGDVLETAIETARTAGINNLVMYTADPNLSTAKDSRLLTSGCPASGTMCVSVPNPSGSGKVKENLVTSAAPGFQTNHIQTQTNGTNHVPFTVATYVTKPTDETGATERHLTVYVTWKIYGQTHTRVDSTYVAATQRGLPLPSFKMVCYNTLCSNPGQKALPGGPVCFGFQITNLGFRDIFNLTATDSAGNAVTGWTFYHDLPDPNSQPVANQLGTCGDEDQVSTNQLADSDGAVSSEHDTGTLENAATTTVWAVGTAPTALCGSPCTNPYSVNFVATSVVDPTLASSVHTITGTIDVESTIAPGPVPPSPCVASATAAQTGLPAGRGFYLHNTSTGLAGTGNTATTNPLTFSTTVPTVTTPLPNYSTDQTSSPSNPAGRFVGTLGNTTLPQIETGATATQVATYSSFVNPTGSNKTYARWQFTVTSNVKATIAAASHFYLDIYARQQPGENGSSPQYLTALIGSATKAGTSFTPQGMNGLHVTNQGGTTNTCLANMSDWRIDIPIPTGFTLRKNSVLEVVVYNNSGNGSSRDMNLGYDILGSSPVVQPNLGPSALYVPSSVSLTSGSG